MGLKKKKKKAGGGSEWERRMDMNNYLVSDEGMVMVVDV